MKYLMFLWAVILCCLLPTFGQKPYIITGIVSDEVGLPLPGASIVVSPGNPGIISAEDGKYFIAGLQPGTCVLLVSYMGYEKYIDTLHMEGNLIRDIRMKPSVQNLQEVVIEGDFAQIRNREEALSLEVVNDEFLKQNLGGSLMKSLDRLPGVQSFEIGSGQSKPVIRGLGFNRVVVIENGIKHEGQQWGSDHGLEVDQYSIDQVEVVRGPSSLMYGSDALGGVIKLNQTSLPERRSWGGSLDMSAKSNNSLLGGSLKLYARAEKFYASLRTTYLDYGDYRVPADSVDIYSYRAPLYNNHLRNTAGKEGAIHLETGWMNKGFSSRFYISRLVNKNGFFANAHGLEPRMVDTELHDRSSRDILYPYHQVSHWKVINRTVWRKELHTLEAELGFQRNFRQEWSQYVSHGYMPAVFPDTLQFPSDLERQFEKYTYSVNIRSTFRLRGDLKFISGIQAEFQNNRIDGRGFIIPAFEQFSSGAFMLMKKKIASKSQISAGLRYDVGHMAIAPYQDWFPSPDIQGGDTTMVYLQRAEQLDRWFSNLSWSMGYNLNLEHFSFKANVGKSFRMPIAKELGANGVNYHHFSYEVGNPDLDPETAYQLDAGMEWHSPRFAIGLSPFLTYFSNYIYLNPSYEHDRLYGNGNQIFIYTQSQVIRYGGEIHSHYQLLRSLKLGLIGEYVYSLQLTGEKEGFTLPFSPPASMILHLKYHRDRIWKIWEPYLSMDLRLVAAQNLIVPPEVPTPGYQVLNLGAGGKIRLGAQLLTVNFQVQNLLNRKYFDHTSYYRLINVPEAGRSFIVNITVPFSNRTTKTESK